MEKKIKGAFRKRTPAFWQLMIASTILLAALVVATSPNLGKPDPTSPEALFATAMELKEKGEYEAAREKFAMVASKKPPTPQIYLQAEEEQEEARRLALQAKKEAEEKAQKEQEAKEQQANQENTEETTPPDEQPANNVPDVDLPDLPDIGGGL